VRVYAEASAVLKLHVDEPESDQAAALLEGVHWASGRHTYVEVRRNLARLLAGTSLDDARAAFMSSWTDVDVIDLAEAVVEHAAELAERTGARALDALHLGAASAAGADDGLPIVTFDRRLADAARSLGWTVLGVQ
jgi:predicted nucleic acid-binding protein